MHKLFKTLTVLTAFISVGLAQFPYTVEATEVAPNIYMMHHDLGGMEVNSIVMMGDDGTLFVDTGTNTNTDSFAEALKSIGAGAPEYIINTHAHTDHTGGNMAFGDKPIIIGHAVIRERLRAGGYQLLEYPDHSLPAVTFTEPISLYYNGEEIKIIPFPGAHDNNDAFVYFTKSNVVYTGDNFYGLQFLTTDGQGNPLNYADAVAKIIEVVPDDAVVIPGHGRQCTMDEMKGYHEMLVNARAIVEAAFNEGKDLATMQADSILSDYESYTGQYVDATTWIAILFNQLSGPQPDGPQNMTVPLYQAVKAKGVKGGIAFFKDVRENQADKYNVGAFPIYNVTANYFMSHRRWKEAIKFAEFGLKEFPDWDIKWAFYELLGEGYMRLGKKKKAIKYYELVLEEDSTYAQATRLIGELKKK
jgi:glyoxylase-like metal-dependent hydrolase (beta-lactamase superfamily II)